jgi:hypothetical protein
MGQVRLRVLLSAVIILVLSISIIQDLGSVGRNESYSFLIGTTSREEYLDKNLGWYNRAARSLHQLPGQVKVLALWEPRGFYLPESVQADVWIDRWFMTIQEFETSVDIINHWKQEEVTHLLINHNGLEFEKMGNAAYQNQDWIILEEVLTSFPPPELFGEEYAIYTIQ